MEKILRVNNKFLIKEKPVYSLSVKLKYFLYTIFLLFIPFQKPLVKYANFDKNFLYLDEVISLLFILLSLFVILEKKKIVKEICYILLPIILFVIAGIISGLYNGNRIIITSLGIFDYTKNFFYILGCYYLLSNYKFLRFIYRTLLRLAILLVIVAMVQEVLYFFNGDVNNFFVPFVITRFGIMRTPSLLGHPNIFGLFILLFFTLNLFLLKRINLTNLLLLVGIFLSISRFIWVSTMIIILIFSFKDKKIFYRLFAIFIFVTFIIFVSPYFVSHTDRELLSQNFYRGYALFKSLEIWNDHKMLGVGPGMYGGVISVMFNSPIYNRYSFSTLWYEEFLQRIHSIDQFWPQLLAETGILGFFAFLVMLFVLYRVPKKLSHKITDPFLKNLLAGISYVPIILGIYLIGSGLNLTAFLVPYLSLLGIMIGVAKDENSFNK